MGLFLHQAFAAAALLAACSPAREAKEIFTYQEVVGDPEIELEAGLARCGALTDPGLAGDCALYVVGLALHRPAPPAESLCPRVPAGAWQDECWFLAAEERAERGRDQSAASLCLRAGSFKEDCAQHLWQTPVHDLAARHGPAGFLAALPEAQRLYDRWAPMLEAETDLADRFWQRFYENGFEARRGVDLRHCLPLPPPHLQRCQAAGLAYFGRELGPMLDRAGAMEAFCALPQADANAVGAWFPNAPEPALDAVIQERKRALCP